MTLGAREPFELGELLLEVPGHVLKDVFEHRAQGGRGGGLGGLDRDGDLGVEGTARALIVHPNTVRYRLSSIAKAIGYDLTEAHDAQTVRIALAFHRLGPVSRSTPRP